VTEKPHFCHPCTCSHLWQIWKSMAKCLLDASALRNSIIHLGPCACLQIGNVGTTNEFWFGYPHAHFLWMGFPELSAWSASPCWGHRLQSHLPLSWESYTWDTYTYLQEKENVWLDEWGQSLSGLPERFSSSLYIIRTLTSEFRSRGGPGIVHAYNPSTQEAWGKRIAKKKKGWGSTCHLGVVGSRYQIWSCQSRWTLKVMGTGGVITHASCCTHFVS
jgi:hypothetical protein